MPMPSFIRFNTFTAIDFETADYYRDSACAVAAVRYENGVLAGKFSSLIRPPRKNFAFSYLHGITWEDVKSQPEFSAVWPEIEKLITGVDFIAAHNASFDRSVLHTCCVNAGIPVPKTRFLCTVNLARHRWNIYPTKLPDVCRHLNIQLDHHQAFSDALACAEIVLRIRDNTVPLEAFI
jgi:DNA polymerase-3 subunit epsilon